MVVIDCKSSKVTFDGKDFNDFKSILVEVICYLSRHNNRANYEILYNAIVDKKTEPKEVKPRKNKKTKSKADSWYDKFKKKYTDFMKKYPSLPKFFEFYGTSSEKGIKLKRDEIRIIEDSGLQGDENEININIVKKWIEESLNPEKSNYLSAIIYINFLLSGLAEQRLILPMEWKKTLLKGKVITLPQRGRLDGCEPSQRRHSL